MTWLICRRSANAPDACIYFTGTIRLQNSAGQLISCPSVSFFRGEARTYGDEELARTIASALQESSPSARDDDWRALPAEIHLPRLCQPSAAGEGA